MNTSELNNVVSPADTFDAYHATLFLTTARGKRCVYWLGEVRTPALLELVFTCVSNELFSLDMTKKHKARELCNEGIWQQLAKAEITCAGICLAFLADVGALPLRMHRTPSGKGPKFYWIY
jgi:hypothetical protein